MDIVSDSNYTNEQKLEIYWKSFEDIIIRLIKANKNVFILDPVPELPLLVGKGASSFSIFGKDTLLDLNNALSADQYKKRHAFILNKLDSLTPSEKLQRIRVFDLLCHDKGCPAAIGDSAIYFDDNHLSLEGARILINRFSNENPRFLE